MVPKPAQGKSEGFHEIESGRERKKKNFLGRKKEEKRGA